MDARTESTARDPLTVTGLGRAVIGETDCDPQPFLRATKLRKYMGLQDELAVVAAGRALESAGWAPGGVAPERIGLYIVVGFIPFEESDILPLLQASLDERGHFSMEHFSTTGYRAVNGLLTFRCLPNMPAF